MLPPPNRLETVLIATGDPAMAAPVRTASSKVDGSHIESVTGDLHRLPVSHLLQLLFVLLPELGCQLYQLRGCTLLVGTALCLVRLVHGLYPFIVADHRLLGNAERTACVRHFGGIPDEVTPDAANLFDHTVADNVRTRQD